MSCNSCSSKFSLLKTEKSCGNCKLSFCRNCLNHKYCISGSPKNVCDECYNKLMFKSESKFTSDVPALLIKRLESMENPNVAPVTVFRSNSKMDGLKSGLSEQDKKLVERLEKLKDNNLKPVLPTEEEIRERLNALKGNVQQGQPSINVPTPKSSSEQVDDLLKQYMDEVKIDESMSDSDDEEAAACRVMRRAADEAALPDVGGAAAAPADEEMETELPWCELCNEDATLRCITCDNALYCRRCLRESHDSFDLKDHKTVPFKKS